MTQTAKQLSEYQERVLEGTARGAATIAAGQVPEGYDSVEDWYATRSRTHTKAKLPPPERPAALDAPALTAEQVAALGIQRFEAPDVTPELHRAAEAWLPKQHTDFEFLLDMQAALNRWGRLTQAQAKGVLNCMLAAERRNGKPKPEPTGPAAFARRVQEGTSRMQKRPATPPAPPADLEAGIYLHDGLVYKVQVAVHGSGKPYAKRLVVDPPGSKGRFEYQQGMVRRLRPEERMTLEQAKEFGAIYGVCCNCGATLTDERSIEAGIGPVCAAKFA